MGVYDSIILKCTCGERIEAQSKSGPCELSVYEMDSVPEDVAADANRHAPFRCDCGRRWQFKEPSKRVTLEIEEV